MTALRSFVDEFSEAVMAFALGLAGGGAALLIFMALTRNGHNGPTDP